MDAALNLATSAMCVLFLNISFLFYGESLGEMIINFITIFMLFYFIYLFIAQFSKEIN